MRRRSESGLRLLESIRARLSKPERWTRHAMARDACGQHRRPSHPDAIKWCLTGALWAEPDRFTDRARHRARRYLREAVLEAGFAFITDFNDRVEHADVVALLDHCIRKIRRYSRTP